MKQCAAQCPSLAYRPTVCAMKPSRFRSGRVRSGQVRSGRVRSGRPGDIPWPAAGSSPWSGRTASPWRGSPALPAARCCGCRSRDESARRSAGSRDRHRRQARCHKTAIILDVDYRHIHRQAGQVTLIAVTQSREYRGSGYCNGV